MKAINRLKIAAVMLAVTAALTMVSCSARLDGAPDGMKLISTEDVDYYLYVPQDWVEDISTGVVSAYVSESDRSNINLAAFDLEDPNMTPAQFWEMYESDITSTFPDAVFSESTNTVIDGIYAAVQHTYTASVTGADYEFMQTVFVHGGAAYILTYTAQADKFDSHIGDVQNIITNIKFR